MNMFLRGVVAVGVLACALATIPACAGSYDDFNAGLIAFNRGEYDNAIRRFSAALAAGDLPAHLVHIAHFDRGFAYGSKGEIDDAFADFSKAAELKPDFADAHMSLGAVHLFRGEPDRAIASFNAAIAIHPFAANGYRGRAEAYRDKMMLDEASTDIDRVLNLDPENSEAVRSAGIFRWTLGRFADAAPNLKKSAKLVPKDPYAVLWFQMGALKTGGDQKEVDDAMRGLEVTAWPRPIADFLLGRKDLEEVVALARQGDAAAQRGQICEVNFYIGEWYLQRGDIAAARPMLERAAADCPDNFIELDPAKAELARLP